MNLLGRRVTCVVITLLTHFSDTQEKEISTAAVAGRFELLQIIDNSVVAVLVDAARQKLSQIVTTQGYQFT